MRSRAFLIMTVFALFAGSAVALAYPAPDTVLEAGYDSPNSTLVFGVSALWQEGQPDAYACTLIGGYNYTLSEDGTTVTSLEADGTADPADPNADTNFEGSAPDSSLEIKAYGDPAVENCTLSAVTIENANHGQIVSSFVHALKDMGLKGFGCLVKVVSQTDWGKTLGGDDEEGSSTTTSTTLATEAPTNVTLDAFQTTCMHGKKDSVDHGKSGDHGRPAWAGPDGDKSLKPGKGPKDSGSDD